MSKKNTFLLITFLMLFLISVSPLLNAQNTVSPYSIFGPGEIQTVGLALTWAWEEQA
ncbi:hypothetical protein [uncultured Draconibacterium sp.]|uniref:hypothetical protein n=1 Tax=uncultured Draconibacterium sp. TaxID=1573823 RepID=UPI0032617DC2